MSRGASIILGIALAVLTLGFAGVAWFTIGVEGIRAATIGMSVLGAFSAIGALACFLPASRPIAARLIGGVVFLAFLGYLLGMLAGGPLIGKSRADQSLVNAFAAFSLFGLPAGYVAITGRYPHWGRHAAVFGHAGPRPPVRANRNPPAEP
jgi:hypothetical protein